jgi:hypothetical protein
MAAPAPRFNPPPSGALAEMMARDAEAEGGPPFGGWAGEMATRSPEPPPPATPPTRFPSPDWDQEERERRARVAEAYFREDTESRPAKRDGRLR